MKTSEQIAIEWGLSKNTVNEMCNKGKISGVVKDSRKWMIPDDAVKPVDKRVSSGKYVQKEIRRRPLPIGVSDYVRAQSEYYYVDKTLFIKEIIDRNSVVSLFTRPRRFGKTLNMDMLRVFFEKTDEDTKKYFEDKAIWKCGEEYRKHQGKYPVIFLTFKDVKYNTWEDTLEKLTLLMQNEFGRHMELASSDKLDPYEINYFNKIVNGEGTSTDLTSSLEMLAKMLKTHYGAAPVIIIDEYDTPIQEGYSKNFYNEIISFMRIFFSGAFKDNMNLSFGFLTGILRIAQESIFSGLNNLDVNSILDKQYDSFFGFTSSEIHDMLVYYGVSDKENELKAWYDGYQFGNMEIYNPWSVINYISKGCVPQAYWVNTGKYEFLEDILAKSTDDIINKLYALLRGEKVFAKIIPNIIYRSLLEDPSNVFTLLLVAGYLKATNIVLQADSSYLCEISIPNREITSVYSREILSHLIQIGAINRTTADKIVESLYMNNLMQLQKALEEYLNKTISFYDAGAEGFYHGLVLGLIALMDQQYKIQSNRESGDGRYDISLFPRDHRYPGIIMELKWKKDLSENELNTLSENALRQINEKRYDLEMKENDITEILKLGIAFSGKHVVVKSASNN